MEMLVIGVIAVVAFGAVLIPLFRRRPSTGDAREFADSSVDASMNVPADDDGASAATTSRTDGPGYVDVENGVADEVAADEVELEVQRYRAAVRAGTVCRKCGQANPAESMFCFDCGERLPRGDAKEFE
jgi:hypothetical protein